MILALLNSTLDAVEKVRPTERDVAAVYPGIVFGDLSNLAEHTLADFPRLVLIREVVPPTPEFGGAIAQDAPTKQSDNRWRQNWRVIRPDIQDLKAKAMDRINLMGSEKISVLELARGLAAGGIPPRPMAILNKIDDVRARVEAAATAAQIKAILDELEAF